ncbi:MAG: hypothetical protein EOP05_22105, partial [Proteobacteria bacterium]
GHRGTGKTSLLRRYEEVYRSGDLGSKKLRPFDLDQEIEFNTSKTVSEIFHSEGEAVFRRLEKEALEKIEAEVAQTQDDVVLVCGAGFDPGLLSKFWHVLWVRRVTDSQGRIFTNRPRLNNQVSPLEEFFERFELREKRFAERADDVLWLDEGIEEVQDPAETSYIAEDRLQLGGAITLLPEHFKTDLSAWITQRLNWGISWFELRDDLLTAEQMRLAFENLPPERALLSFRDPEREGQSAGWIDRLGVHYDWPVERGDCPFGTPRYLSLHTRETTLEETFKKFPDTVAPGTQLKAALPVHSVQELELAHRWQMAKPSQRLLLPMSGNGRWNWYRLLRGNDYSLNFIRESLGSSL